MRTTPPLLSCLLLLGSCGSPPKPPTVDESTKRPANSALAVDLQMCRSELQYTRIGASEARRVAESAAATLARASARQQAVAAAQAASAPPTAANAVFAIRFDFGSTRVVVPADGAAALLAAARTAPLVVLRGRTDGAIDSPAEGRIARERALAVRDYLVGAGVDAARIRATYQPAGDFAADNTSPTGRAMNRRVEIEVYRSMPVSVATSAATTS